jgi:PmbA protein
MIMNKEMSDLVAWVIKATKSAGADHCKVNLDSNRSVEVSYRDRQPENIKEASTKALNIEIYVNGRFSIQSTSDLRKGALQDFIANAVAATKLLAEDPLRTLPEPKYYQGRAELDLELVDPLYKSFSPENRHDMVKALEKACLQEGGRQSYFGYSPGAGRVSGIAADDQQWFRGLCARNLLFDFCRDVSQR